MPTQWNKTTKTSTQWTKQTKTSTQWGKPVVNYGFLLIETGSYLLQENNSKLIITRLP